MLGSVVRGKVDVLVVVVVLSYIKVVALTVETNPNSFI